MSNYDFTRFTRRKVLKGIAAASSAALITGMAKGDVPLLPEGQSRANAFVLGPEQGATIVIGESVGPLGQSAAERVARHIHRVTGKESPIVSANNDEDGLSNTAVIALSIQPIVQFRPDGYRISTSQNQGKARVHLSAPSEVGLKYASYRLIREMRQEGKRLHLPVESTEANPWLKTREIFIADLDLREPAHGEKKQIQELLMKFDWQNWDVSMLEQYVDQVDAMGYNSLMLTDPNTLAAFTPGALTRSADMLSEKVVAMYKRARQNGMTTAFFLWGQQGVGAIAVDTSISRNNPLLAEDASRIRDHWKDVIERFGPWVDRWVLHWADPGGSHEEGCTIKTPQEMTNDFLKLLRQMRYSSDVSFSLWALRVGKDPSDRPWRGYTDWTSVVNSGILSPEIGIAMMRHYDYAQAKGITAQYRKAGVWGWYLNDVETNSSLHVHHQILEMEFRRTDVSASDLLDWYSLEDNNHCLNVPSLYAGAQMLWDTRSSGVKAIESFCEATFGRTASQNIARALQAIGEVRCGTGEYLLNEDWWPNDYMCWLGKGSDSPCEDLSICENALRELEAVEIDADHVPQLPLIVQPGDLLRYIHSHLVYVLQFARIRVAYREALQLARKGRFEETQERMQYLPRLPEAIDGVYGAGMEVTYCDFLNTFASLWKGRTFRDNLALGKTVTASSWFNNQPSYSPKNAVNGILCEFNEEGWVAGASGPAWLKIDLEAPELIKSVRIYNRAYQRELLNNNIVATPSKVEAFYAETDPSPSIGVASDKEPGYHLIGGFDNWAPTMDPGAYREIRTTEPVLARFVKVVIYTAANGQPAGCGEIEVRKT